MGLRETASKAVFWASFGWIITQVLNFAVSIVTARLLAPELFGLITLILTIVSAAAIFADAGTRAALVHFDDPIEDSVSTAMVVLPVVGAIASLGVAAFSWQIADFYGEPRLQPLAVALSGILFIQTLSIVPDALLQRRFDLKLRRGLVDPLSVLLYGIVVIVLAVAGANEWALVAGQYASVGTVTVGCFILARPRFRAGRATVATWRRIAKYGRHLLVTNIIEVAQSQAAPVALGRNVSATSVGLYGAGNRLSTLPVTGITHVAGQVIFPALSRLQGEPERMRARFLESLRLISLLTIPMCVFLMGMGEPLVVVLFGERWRGAGTVLQILAVWGLCHSMTGVAREAFKAAGVPGQLARNAMIDASITLAAIAAFWATGHISIESVSGARAAASVVALLVAARALRHVADTRFRHLWPAVRPSLVGGAVQLVALLLLTNVAFPGFESWHHIGGVNLGPVVPLLVLAGLGLCGAAAYGVAAEIAERGVLRSLASNIKLIVRPGSAAS